MAKAKKTADGDGLTLAVSKGRILSETLPLLAAIGVVPAEDPAKSRKLILGTNRRDLRLLVIRAQDVPTYVEYGAADLGIAGKDVLAEHGGEGLYERLDLKIAPCRMMTAGFADRPLPRNRLRVATKYPRITRRFFHDQGRQVELIKLYGSMELAPIVGLADVIVDLVDTGNTLKANGLVPLELIMDISSRLIINRASLKMKHRAIESLVARIEQAIE